MRIRKRNKSWMQLQKLAEEGWPTMGAIHIFKGQKITLLVIKHEINDCVLNVCIANFWPCDRMQSRVSHLMYTFARECWPYRCLIDWALTRMLHINSVQRIQTTFNILHMFYVRDCVIRPAANFLKKFLDKCWYR